MGQPMDRLLPALLCLAAGLLPVHCFNLETDDLVSFSEDQHSQFGHMVTQFQNWMLVSAPLMEDDQGVRTGAIYKCRYNEKRCNQIKINLPKGSKNLGLSLTTGDSAQPKAVTCVPRFSYECHTNTYINGYCDVLDSSLNPSQRVPNKLPECPKALIDIAFLIDGSGSVAADDFSKMKSFMVAIIKKFSNKQTQIAVAQFSHTAKTEFSFMQYRQASNKEVLVNNIWQTGGGTNTPRGIQYVADNIFVTSAGARNGAKRILITITDGESYNTDFTPAINTANQKNIRRYAIGVGSAFINPNAKSQLDKIASEKKNVFQVSNFQALDNIQKELQEKIFAIEGTQGAGAISSFQLEMAQEGFSSLVTSKAVVLGAVGAYDWSGGLAEFKGGVRTFINLTASQTDMKNAYLGYTVKEAKRESEAYYITGAPRYKHKGRILIFSQSNRGEERQRIDGVQIGSYFGSELCPVDLNKDGETDLLLVGAPMYHDQEIGGIVHVYKMMNGGQLQALDTLSGERGKLLGRFGTAIAEVRDLNGDGISDVAIGAPLEDGHQGSVYIYHGAKDRINPTPSQHIRSMEIQRGLKYFGRSIHGSMDVSGDGLTDIAVGALGNVFVLRSRPVVDVTVSITFVPNKILLKDVDCPEPSVGGSRIKAKICFSVRQLTSSSLVSPSINITYNLDLDPGRKIQRAELHQLPQTPFILSRIHCLERTIQVEDCIRDYYNPIILQVIFSGLGQKSGTNPPPILRQSNKGIHTGKLPFEQECGTDNICTDHLNVSFTVAGTRFLVVGSYSTLTVDVTLENLDENSYFTVVTFLLPTGLSFRKTSIIQASRRSHIECDDSMNSKFSSVGKVFCRINHPIFRTMGKVIFNTTFDVAADVEWKQSAVISVNATSDNEKRITTDSFVSKTIGVKYEVNVIIKGIKSTQYINFTTDKPDDKHVKHTYKVENVGLRSLPIGITFSVPVKIRPGMTWEEVKVNSTMPNNAQCQEKDLLPRQDFKMKLDGNNSQSCNMSVCRVFVCQIKQLRSRQSPSFTIWGVVRWINTDQARTQEFTLASYAAMGYDENKYIHVSQATNHFQWAMVNTRVEIVEEFNPLPIILGSSIGGLVLLAIVAAILYKVGFFKRGYKDMLQEGEEDAGPSGIPAEPSGNPAEPDAPSP